MATGVGGAIKRAGGDEIEFAAVRQGPLELGQAVVTPAGALAARIIIHAVSLDRDRRTSAVAIEAAVHSAMARAREHNVTSIAFPALGTGVGGYPIDEAAQITLDTIHQELPASPSIEVVTFALRGASAYAAFEAALHAAESAPAGGPGEMSAG
ncbi:MAG TPA: macro domain-containing protein [Candidatus Limnocylindrales bacterium]|jgi:O-acetyl-ADP-ribose deacetylase (regulator of RNase III)